MKNQLTKNFYTLSSSKYMLMRLCLVFVCWYAGSAALCAQQTIIIQGTLKQTSGAPLEDGFYRVSFKLYTTISEGSPLWQETTDSLSVIGGIYTHALGSKTNLTNAMFNATVYLGIVLDDYESEPRTEITYAPYALAASTTVCSGAVGDVQYSILSPTQFAQENGSCWVPMDGRDITGSKLSSYVSSIPNAGGNFLRSQEFGGTYASGNIDPDRTSTSSIATAQGNDNKSHNHSASSGSAGAHTHDFTDYDNRNCTGFALVESGCDGVSETNNTSRAGTTTSDGDHAHTVTIANNGGAESRPKNLNLWIYIRIN
jgi:hypothetical protein